MLTCFSRCHLQVYKVQPISEMSPVSVRSPVDLYQELATKGKGIVEGLGIHLV